MHWSFTLALVCEAVSFDRIAKLFCTSIHLIGGLHLALRRSKVQGTVECAFDWDQAACQVYKANHGQSIVQQVRHFSNKLQAEALQSTN